MKKNKKASVKNSKVKEIKSSEEQGHFKLTNSHLLIIGILIILIIALVIAFNIDKLNVFFQKNLAEKDYVVASVNGQNITNKELQREYDFFFALSGYPQEYKQILTKQSYLDQKIVETILIQEAVKKGYTVSNNRVEEDIDHLVNSSKITKDELDSKLKEAGFSIEDLKEYLKKQILFTDLINKTVLKNIKVSDLEIKDYYDNHTEFFDVRENEDMIRVKHILVKTEDEAKELVKQIWKNPDDFEKIAKEKSIDSSAKYGGDLGIITKGQTIPEFEKVAFSLTIGEISDPVKTQFGYHIIKRGIGQITLEEAKGRIKEALILEKQKVAVKEYIDNLKEKSEIVLLDEKGHKTISEDLNKTAESVDSSTCYGGYGLSKETVIFYHADWCPHCQNMMPIVKELEADGYKFHWAETTSGKGVEAVTACFKDVVKGGVPEFICAGTKEIQLGEMSKEGLKSFADKCKE